MTEIIGVRFRTGGKVYYFSPGEYRPVLGDLVIVDTARGTECGEVTIAPEMVEESRIVQPLKPILRIATEKDKAQYETNRRREIYAAQVCEQKIAEHGLDMKLVDVECTFDNSKILFYFTSDDRVDFRELVRDLAGILRTRIELRQIGVRDEARMLGGLGICGRPFCCKTFLTEFVPVSIRMAKEQGLSLNPTKISGTCGRLMCCLKYEQNYYEQAYRSTPKVGAYVQTPQFKGYVEEVNLITEKLRVKPENSDEASVVFDKKDVTLIKEAKQRFHKEDKPPRKPDQPDNPDKQ
ncbi:MAG: stage 0 sporulation family protein [Oscillospiraceae bacterium]|jgi:cell fate regulator YaaT (PSP1 superfamily)|nr:stage 0 sporulation family protein [Oscillospiraceae bacterium]